MLTINGGVASALVLVLTVLVLTVLVLAGVASAADPTVFSGPQPGERLPPLKVVLAYVGENMKRREQLVRVAEILSQGRTRVGSIPATQHLQRWKALASSLERPPAAIKLPKTCSENKFLRVYSAADPQAVQRKAEAVAPKGKHSAVAVPVLFDFGTATSPVARSSVQVTDRHRYDPIQGFGWLTDHQQAFDRDKPLAELRHGGNPMRPDLLYKAHATPLNRDGVAATQDMWFRIHVKPGKYRVHVWMGDLHQPLKSLALDANQRTIGTGISAKRLIGRSQPEATGLYQLLRFDVDAGQGRIELRFYGDNSQFERDQRRYDAWFPAGRRVESYLASGLDPKRRLKFDPRGPFTRNSVLAVRVDAAQEPVFEWSGSGQLLPVGQDSADKSAFVAAFNTGDFRKAEAILDRNQASLARPSAATKWAGKAPAREVEASREREAPAELNGELVLRIISSVKT